MSKAKESFLPPLWLLSLFFIFLMLWLVVALKEIVVLIVLGYCLAYVINPVVDFLEKKKMSRSLSIAAICIFFVLVLISIISVVVPTLSRELTTLLQNLPQYSDKFRAILSTWNQKLISLDPRFANLNLNYALQHIELEQLKPLLQKLFSAMTSTLMSGYSITLTLVNIFLLPFIFYYLAVDFNKFHMHLLEIVPPRYKKKILGIFSQINVYISAFVRGQFLVGFVLFLLYAIGLGIVGVDLWFVLALISGFGNIIPYFGFMLGIVLTSIMSFLTFGDFIHFVYVLIVYGCVQALEGSLITPKIIGNKVGLSPLAIILSIFAAGKLLGLLGIFLAVPIAAILKVLLKELHQWAVAKV